MAGGSQKILMLVFMFACCVSILVGSLTGLFVYGDGDTTTTTDDGSDDGSGDDNVTNLFVKTTLAGDTLPEGIKAWYTGTSLDKSGLLWRDRSGEGNDIKNDNIKGSLKLGLDPVSGNYVYGTTEDGITIPLEFSESVPWTVFVVARYNGEKKGRIFDAKGKNWLAGWHAGRTGLAYYGDKGWVTPIKISHINEGKQPVENVHGSGRTWIQATFTNRTFYSNGTKRSTKLTGDPPGKITINMGDHAATESSDWAVHEIIIYNKILDASTRGKVEKYLLDTYISPEIQSGIDYTKGWDPSVNHINRNELGGTLEKCRLYAIKMGYKMWGHRTEKHDDNLKNICFFYPNTDGVSYEGDTSDDKNIVGCTEKGAKLKDGCETPSETV